MIPFRTTWATYQGDSANSGYAALLTAPALREKWTAPALFMDGCDPVVDPFDGAIYISDTVGHLFRYDPEASRDGRAR